MDLTDAALVAGFSQSNRQTDTQEAPWRSNDIPEKVSFTASGREEKCEKPTTRVSVRDNPWPRDRVSLSIAINSVIIIIIIVNIIITLY